MLCLDFDLDLLSMKMRVYIPAHLFTLSSSLIVTTPRDRIVMVWVVRCCSLREIHHLILFWYWLSTLSLFWLWFCLLYLYYCYCYLIQLFYTEPSSKHLCIIDIRILL